MPAGGITCCTIRSCVPDTEFYEITEPPGHGARILIPSRFAPAIRCVLLRTKGARISLRSPMNSLQSLRSLAIAASLSALLLAGCRIVDNKNGKNDNVAISTPFGSMQVKTNDNADASTIGLTIYPGSVPAKDGDNDHDAADVNMSFGDFHLGVKAAGYQTEDSTDKVLAFYRKDLARYGDVIECRNDNPVGTPTRTSQGLTCDNKNGHHHVHSSDDGVELRAGSEQREHIVGIEQKHGGTHIGLVMLNLPTGLHSHDEKEPE